MQGIGVSDTSLLYTYASLQHLVNVIVASTGLLTHDLNILLIKAFSCHYHLRDAFQCLKDVDNMYVDNTLAWDRPGVGQAALYMFIEAIVLSVIIILIEVRTLHFQDEELNM